MNSKLPESMNLQKFITQSIEDICYGVRDAQKNILATFGNYPIAPAYIDGKPVPNFGQTSITFDITVTLSQEKLTNGEGKIEISVVSAALNHKRSSVNENQNRIQFSVPFYPQALNAKDKK